MATDNIQLLNNILSSLNVKANCINYKSFDKYYYYDLQLVNGGKVNDIQKFKDEIALGLKTNGKPNIKIIHISGLIRLEFIKQDNSVLNLFDIFTNEDVPEGELICLLGKAIDGKNVWMDLCKNPHMIIAGTSGSGKSVLLHNIIANIFNYNKTSLFLIDPKNIEFSCYEDMPNTNVCYNYEQANYSLDLLMESMEDRFKKIRSGWDVKEIIPTVLIIDEFADLILQDDGNVLFKKLCMLSQKCRAAKIHIILSTQRPSVNIVNGSIKANFPARIACKVASHFDSKVILDSVGAEHLVGNGDALIKDNYRHLDRFQVAFVDPKDTVNAFKAA